jgi:NADH dehydrogenase
MPGHPEVYIIGDAVYWEEEGEPLPMVAPAAIQQAQHAADNIRRELRGDAAEAFVYKSPGALATIGRNAAVAEIGRFRLRGFLAWVVWLVVHLMRLVGFRNRLVVLIYWAWDYLFYDRAVRVIMPDARWPWTIPNDR